MNIIGFTISFGITVKLFLIFLIIMLHIFLIYIKHNKPIGLNVNKNYLESGLIDSKILKATLLGFIGGANLYGTYFTITNDRKQGIEQSKAIENKLEALDEAKKILYKDIETNQNLKVAMLSSMDRIREICNINNYSKWLNPSKNVEKNKQLTDPLTVLLSKEWEKSNLVLTNEAEKLFELVNKSSILDLDKLSSMFESLDVFKKLALSLLLLNGVIGHCFISIIFIIYGEYLLNKYPACASKRKISKISKIY
jgi:hypothetical protein